MPKVSAEHKSGRREEIINACSELYETMGFRDITLKEIGTYTSFSRPSIYNYFKTKEEIFLALLTREYECWIRDIQSIMEENETLTEQQLADKLARTMERREKLLKISAMNLYEIEENSSVECLQEYKIAFRGALGAVCACMEKYMPQKAEEKKQLMQYGLFPFTYGIYPYTHATEKQSAAMEAAGITFQTISIYEMSYRFLCQMFR